MLTFAATLRASIERMSDHLARPDTRESLAAHLEAIGVRPGTFHLFGAPVDDAIVMDQRPERWAVFYTERGNEMSLSYHPDEASACADLLARVTDEPQVFFDLVAGPAPALEADSLFDEWLAERGGARGDLRPADWMSDDVPWVSGACWRRYFVRITTIRRLSKAR